MNYIVVDAYRAGEFLWWFNSAWSYILQLFLSIGVFFGVVGFGALSGLVSLFICGFLNVPPAKILKTCQTELMMALNIHKKNGTLASPEGVADRRLMALICGIKGDYEATLEHYDLMGMAIAANGQEIDVASIDCSIGDKYLSLARYDKVVFFFFFLSKNTQNVPSDMVHRRCMHRYL